MTEEAVLDLFRKIGHEIRWPTARWLLVDVFNVVDCDARSILMKLIDNGHLIMDNGGWLNLSEGYTCPK